MTPPAALVDRQRRLLAEVFPEAEPMAESLRQNFPEYLEVTGVVAELVDDLCGGEEPRLRESLAAYVRFSDVFKQKQLAFARSGSLGHTDYERVRREVYDDPRYMLDVYYPSLLFSYLFASNYYEILRIFRTRFVPLAAGVRSCCEIGIGHALLTGLLARDNPSLRALGLDVSSASPTIARRVLQLLGIAADRVEVVVGDAIERPAPEPGALFEAGICAEVLEHVPDPAALLAALRNRLAIGAPAFLTAAINMESVDHLYLFRTDDEVVELVERSGFQVLERHVGLLSRRSDARQPEIARELVRRRNPATAILLVRAA